MMDGLADVVSRISQIQTQLGLNPTTATTTASSTSGADFAAQLAALEDGEPADDTGGDPAGGGGSPLSGTVTGAAVVADARKYLGIPYVFGGTNPATGLDCSGLTQLVYRDLGIKLPRTAAEQAKVGQAVPSLAQAQPGDLLAFNSPVTHIAIYIGNGMMIAAPHTGDHVKIEKVYATPSTIRRIVSPGTATAALRPSSLQSSGTLSGVPYANLFEAAAARYGVSAKLLAAVAKVESNYDPRAVSSAGAQGLMQIMPATARQIGVNPFDPAQAVDGAARILAGNLQQFGSVPLALAAYNAGSGAVRRYGGIPPFAQTRAYVPKVEAAMAALG
ncbi:MAG TPA: transglycosylase SLT domain-containing protein [Rugosimonospora sp.]|nr:transglycosylase SLT domain-containing protein [Rugosimonospora sp.]